MCKKNKGGKLTETLRNISLRQMHALSDYKEAGVDCQIIIGDEDELRDMVRNIDLSGATFTSFGKLKEKRIAKFLQKAKEKYRVEIQIFCVRGVR